MTDFLEDLTARAPDKAVADAGDVHQIFALVNADDQRIEAVRAWEVRRAQNVSVSRGLATLATLPQIDELGYLP